MISLFENPTEPYALCCLPQDLSLGLDSIASSISDAKLSSLKNKEPYKIEMLENILNIWAVVVNRVATHHKCLKKIDYQSRIKNLLENTSKVLDEDLTIEDMQRIYLLAMKTLGKNKLVEIYEYSHPARYTSIINAFFSKNIFPYLYLINELPYYLTELILDGVLDYHLGFYYQSPILKKVYLEKIELITKNEFTIQNFLDNKDLYNLAVLMNFFYGHIPDEPSLASFVVKKNIFNFYCSDGDFHCEKIKKLLKTCSEEEKKVLIADQGDVSPLHFLTKNNQNEALAAITENL